MLNDLIAEDVTGDIAGSGSAKVYANNMLEASIAGSGDIIYYGNPKDCLLYTSPSPRDRTRSRMPSSA